MFGPYFQKKLKKLGIETLHDLLYHFPHRYEDFSELTKIRDVKLKEKVWVKGKILDIKNFKTQKRKISLTRAVVGDESGAISVIWFNQPYLVKVLKKGTLVSLAGKVHWGKDGLYLSNPDYEKINQKGILIHTGRLVPIYPETEGVTSRWLRRLIFSALKEREKIKEILPPEILRKEKLLPVKDAILKIHFPNSLKDAERAKERFAFEELFVVELAILRERLKLKEKKAPKIPFNLELIKEFVQSLPFDLTKSQKKAIFEILKDLERERPMNRLLQGDVGSGKTICAMAAALEVCKSGYQVAVMAPTEILAHQHFENFLKFLGKFDVEISLFTRGQRKILWKKISKKKILEEIERGKVEIVIGTHTLIEENVKFKNLGLVILDEQHRFGVEQRARLCESSQKNSNFVPHFLSMTATPIPRTLALALYGDLDFSRLEEMPPGRKPPITKIVLPKDREKIYQFIRERIKKNNEQTFFICPRIEKKETEEEIKTVKEEYEKLAKEIFPDLKIAMLYGKMKPKEKEKIVGDFKKGKIQILVSTSVVEVGMDIPGVTIMVIENAERFGLAQLHQMRGRVGRREKQGFCFLFAESLTERLKAMVRLKDGLKLAEEDLKLRGPGEFLGQRQWGIPDLAMSFLRNFSLVERVQRRAKEILEKDPQLDLFPELKKKVKEIEKKLHLE